ncbi:MAG: phage tail length tape measure family protein [Nitrincola lacisaponensis]|uniref:phage tail length tape measure family protein n=1 Tax=Nitrincola lacisaponensis TaxID=267850 RepID=UPI003918E8F2
MSRRNLAIRLLISAKDEASGVLGGLRRNAGKVAAAITGYFSIRFFKGAIDEAEALDVQLRKLEAVIEATGGAAGLTAQEIDEMARRLDAATTGSAAGFRDAAIQLATFKSVGKDAFETTLMLAQDLADAGFGTLTSNAVQLGKALEDPVKGLTALTRSGVSFTEQQQRVIQTLVETGRQAEAQGVILEAVAGQVVGVASKIGGGLTGLRDLVSMISTDIREQLGTPFLAVLERGQERLASFYQRLRDSGVVTRFGEVVANAFDMAQTSLFNFLDNFDLDTVVDQLKNWMEQTKESVDVWVERMDKASTYGKITFLSLATGVQTLQAAFHGFAGVVAQVVAGIIDRFGAAFGLFSRFSSTAKQISEDADNLARSFRASAEENYQKAAEAIDKATESGRELREAYEQLSETQVAASESIEQLVESESALAEQSGITADQLDALGDSADYMGDQAEHAAAGINAVTDAARQSVAEMMEAELATQALNDAYDELGVTSQKALDDAAEKARAAFETIKTSGTATSRELQQAFQAYAQRAIDANNGVASSALKTEAAQNGLKLTADETGRVIVEAMNSAARATSDVKNAADSAANSYRRMAQEARNAGDAKNQSDRGTNDGDKKERVTKSGGSFRAGKYSMSDLEALDPELARRAAEAVAALNMNLASDGSSTAYRKERYESAMRNIESAAKAAERQQESQRQATSTPEQKPAVSTLDELSKSMEKTLAGLIEQTQKAEKKVELTLNLPGNVKATGLYDNSEADKVMRSLTELARISR